MEIPFDPPVHPFSDVVEIRRWIDRLHELSREYRDDGENLHLIQERIRDAECWLEFRGYRAASHEPGGV
ncbi:MAG TPA: hypothetical protein VF212_06530 [Longimicrobiales bacterium]